ncbi:MAG: GerAB/ArcD/ProY family transporter [Firmicutes bacterium]|nr:GerAB/ArcD/ProY family transporter [Bacillota bacterium]
MEKTKKISTRQLIIFYCIYSFSLKFLALPRLLATTSGRDAWLAAIIGTVVELLVLFMTLNILTMRQDTSVYDDLKRNTTRIGAKFVMILMLSMFLLQLFVLTGTSNILVTEQLFHSIGKQAFLIPLVLFGLLFCVFQARAMFRAGEIFYLLIIFGVVIGIAPAVRQMDLSMLTPIGEGGFMPILLGAFRNLVFFESAMFLLIFSGEVEIKKHFKTKFMLTSTLVGLIFVFFVFMTITLFGPLAEYKTVAIANITMYSKFLVQGGQLDWILVCIWLLLLLIRFGVTFYCVFACCKYIFGLKKFAWAIGLVISITLWAVYTFAVQSTERLDSFVIMVATVTAVLFILVPAICFINALIARKRKVSA